MILPERVLGNDSTNVTLSGRAIGPISEPTCSRSSSSSSLGTGVTGGWLSVSHKDLNPVTLDPLEMREWQVAAASANSSDG